MCLIKASYPPYNLASDLLILITKQILHNFEQDWLTLDTFILCMKFIGHLEQSGDCLFSQAGVLLRVWVQRKAEADNLPDLKGS